MNFTKILDGKNSSLKQRIIGLCINDGDYSLADLSKELDTSIPTTTKLVGELVDDGLLVEIGKLGTNGGRRPSIFGLNPSAGYFVGVDIRRKFIGFAVTDFKGAVIDIARPRTLLGYISERSTNTTAQIEIAVQNT